MKAINLSEQAVARVKDYTQDWCLFARELLGVNLDPEQEAILQSVQVNKRTSVASGTSRGKDFVSAVAALCFLYLTPTWDKSGKLVGNTKVFCTAPTGRQVEDIMTPEITRLFNGARARLPGRLVSNGIRMEEKEWFLTGFKAGDTKPEVWAGLHAVNTMFVITEATGLPEIIYSAIEGNLQGNSRLLLAFNPNISTGYAAASQRSQRWSRFRLNSLNAPNVVQREMIIPGQVDYEWVVDKVRTWCELVPDNDYLESEGDFPFELDGERRLFRPNDEFRKKVLGLFPKVDSGVLIPYEWIEAANNRWKEFKRSGEKAVSPLRLGSDVAGMGRDSSCECYRYGNYTDRFEMHHSGGRADHMATAGRLLHNMKANQRAADGLFPQVFIDTIGEGAGVYSRLLELAAPGPANISEDRIHSVKFSESAVNGRGLPLKDITDCYEFYNMRAYCYWGMRDWLNPANNMNAMLPPDDDLAEELTQTTWEFMSNGKVKIESKEEVKKRIGRSPDKSDSLANTFFPAPDIEGRNYMSNDRKLTKMFF